MRNFFVQLFHELRLLLLAPGTYIAAVLFLLLMGWVFLMSIGLAARELEDILPTTFFFYAFWIPVLFMIPLLTMQSLAEERRRGTLETLLTTPTGPLRIVSAKFLAAYTFYCGLWLLTLGFPMIIHWYEPAVAEAAQLFTPAPLLGGLAFVAISGTCYIAIGIFCSSLTRSQLVAGMLTFCLLFLLILGSYFISEIDPAQSSLLTDMTLLFDYVQPYGHLQDFSRGIIDTRPLFLYLSITALLLGLTTVTVEMKA